MSTPRFSVVTPVYNPPLDVLGEMIDSVVAQNTDDWELVLADDASPDARVLPYLRERAAADSRIRVIALPENQGIVGASNAALAAASGTFIAFMDNDDLLTPHALSSMAEAIDAQPDADYLYSDEDKLSARGERYDLFFKPEWSPERLRGHMYLGHLSVMRRALVTEVGGFREGFDGSQDHDLALRVTERSRHVVHVPDVLYHWRAIPGSSATVIDAKPYAWDAGVRAVTEHLQRIGIAGHAEKGPAPSHYRVVREPDLETPTSIVIPTRGSGGTAFGGERVFVLEAVRSILATSEHRDLEFVVVSDTDTPRHVEDSLAEMLGDRLTLVRYAEEFNFSRKCNAGFLAARGTNIIFLNDDVEAISAGVPEQLIAPLREPGVGMTGARLLYENRELQHGGHLYSNGHFGHAFIERPEDDPGPFSALFVSRETMGLTAACLAVTRETFEAVGGFSEEFSVNFNDVDLSLKVLNHLDRRLVWLRDVVLYHFESRTRENVIKPAEYALAYQRWGTPRTDRYLPGS